MRRALLAGGPAGQARSYTRSLLLRVGLPITGVLAMALVFTAAFRVPANRGVPPLIQQPKSGGTTTSTGPFKKQGADLAQKQGGSTVLALSTSSASEGSPKASSSSPLSGAILRDRDGNQVDPSQLQGKSVALLFAAAWCPSCRHYSPSVVAFYEGINAAAASAGRDKAIEIVMVSSDESRADLQSHLKPYPWLAVDFDDPARSLLKKTYRVWAMREAADFAPQSRDSGIPTLVVIDEAGKELERIRLELVGVKGLEKWNFKEWAWTGAT